MNQAAIWDAIRDRLVGDTGTGGLFNSGSPLLTAFYYAAIPTSGTMPYAVLSFASDTENDAFAKDIRQIVFRINVFVPRIHATITDPTNRGSQILARIYGDTSAGSAPTYGLHRWQPSLSGSWSAAHVQQAQAFDEHTDDTYSWVLEYKLTISK